MVMRFTDVKKLLSVADSTDFVDIKSDELLASSGVPSLSGLSKVESGCFRGRKWSDLYEHRRAQNYNSRNIISSRGRL